MQTASYNIKGIKEIPNNTKSKKITIEVGLVKVHSIELVYNENGEVIALHVHYDPEEGGDIYGSRQT